MDLSRCTSEILQGEFLFRIDLRLGSGAPFARNTLVPTYNRIVIMRACIRDAVDRIVVRQIERCRDSFPEAKLNDAHPWKMEHIAERVHLGCDKPEILGDHW